MAIFSKSVPFERTEDDNVIAGADSSVAAVDGSDVPPAEKRTRDDDNEGSEDGTGVDDGQVLGIIQKNGGTFPADIGFNVDNSSI